MTRRALTHVIALLRSLCYREPTNGPHTNPTNKPKSPAQREPTDIYEYLQIRFPGSIEDIHDEIFDARIVIEELACRLGLSMDELRKFVNQLTK